MKVPNPFQSIYEQCSLGAMAQKATQLPAFPRMIDIELTNECNFNCVMCPTGQKIVKRKKGYMTQNTFLELLPEIIDNKTPIRFIRWGEPMMSPILHWALVTARENDLLCHLNTNGSLMDDEWMQFFLEVGLDSIKFSFQGVNSKGYRCMRRSKQYDRLLAKIEKMHNLREALGAEFPFIQIGTTITSEPESAIKAFRQQVEPFTDALYISQTMDLQQLRSPDRYCECPEVFDKLSVNWDGSVSACCGDWDNFMVVGNIYEQSLTDIWNGRRLSDIREHLVNYRHGELVLCSRCARSLDNEVR